jgi:hypothetical protein
VIGSPRIVVPSPAWLSYAAALTSLYIRWPMAGPPLWLGIRLRLL